MSVLVTGSSGLVGSALIPRVEMKHTVMGVDRNPSFSTSHVSELSTLSLDDLEFSTPYTVIHLAAARFDHGTHASRYYQENVEATECFLSTLDANKLKAFIHVSSVAALDGSKINYSDRLSCDDAYRATKFLQERKIKQWAVQNGVPLYILYPSAIFDNNERADTNIGKLQLLARYMPFVPEIGSLKSLTFLPNFITFMVHCLEARVAPGAYLTIERPVLSVTQILVALTGRSRGIISIPVFKFALIWASHLLWIMSGFGKVDLGLTPSRVKKLFSDTSYEVLPSGIDAKLYNSDAKSCFELLRGVGGFK